VTRLLALIAAVVYFFVVIPMNKMLDRFKGEEPVGLRTRECPECLSKISEAARRCAFCTADVGAAMTALR
jgi:large conductance mechanosensitive channel